MQTHLLYFFFFGGGEGYFSNNLVAKKNEKNGGHLLENIQYLVKAVHKKKPRGLC